MKPQHFETIQEKIKENFLERARNGLFAEPYPGYPGSRYVASDASCTVVPKGPWCLYNEHATPLTEQEQAELRQQGVRVNEDGDPVHPWLSDMVADPVIGVIGGPGAYWHRGPNYTADPIVISRFRKKVLLIKRGDTDNWALPGGFIDGHEPPVEAALRELAEEARLGRFLRILSKPVLLYAGIVADKRTTAVSWAQTHAILFRPLLPWRHIRAEDDALGSDHSRRARRERARWFSKDELPESLFGSHRILVDEAFTCIDSRRNRRAH